MPGTVRCGQLDVPTDDVFDARLPAGTCTLGPQSGHNLPDGDRDERWTFTLFAGEPLTDGQAESGTVLHGKICFRLGKPSRGIGSARVAPAIIIG